MAHARQSGIAGGGCSGQVVDDCGHAGPPGRLVTSDHPIGRRLARAWLSMGSGGMLLFLSYGVFMLDRGAVSSVVAWVAGLGGVLVARGGHVVSRTERSLRAVAALPPARVVR